MKKLIIDNVDSLFLTLNDKANQNNTIILLFTGSKDSGGESWCPDCNVADPVIQQVINDEEYDSDNYLSITIYTGERAVWKDPNNAFRTHKDLRIKSVPTLMKWKTSLRLEESQCADSELVRMLIED